MRTLKRVLVALMILFFFHVASAVETHTKLWIAPVFTGSLSQDKKVKFYLEPDLRFIDNRYKFQQALLWMGLGYQLRPKLALFARDALLLIKMQMVFIIIEISSGNK